MRFRHRIRTVYGKELIDILRDRRTLIAMIVVPIVLYPLLMVGSIQAVSIQVEGMVSEVVIIGVTGEAQRQNLLRLIHDDSEWTRQQNQTLPPDAEGKKKRPIPLDEIMRIFVCGSIAELDERIATRQIQAGIVFARDQLVDNPTLQNGVNIRADYEEVRSERAAYLLSDMIERVSSRTIERRKATRNLPELFDQPFAVERTNLASPPSILGQVLPLVLILMTITGAIYPAIDLTAGERERGTLESLMVCPVPVIDLIVGKFLVVTTVAIMGAALNLASVSATVYFGGFDKVLANTGGGVSVSTMALILLCLIPFAVLMSAIMIAVCSYARTFKEAQNYVTPVILAVLIPGGIAALPATKSEGLMLVMPVGNMVLLARDLLLGAEMSGWNVATVLLSTTLYAAAAVAVAAGIFGKESVVFADSGSLRQTFSRSLFKPSRTPSVSMALLVVALLFPTWFFVQSSLSPDPDAETAVDVLYGTGRYMPLLFVVLPVLVLAYWKTDLRESLRLRMPPVGHLLAGLLIGLSAWVPSYELDYLRKTLLGASQIETANQEMMVATFAAMPLAHIVLLVALVPAICEELLFRGFLFSGLCRSAGKWGTILVTAIVFGVFHFYIFKIPVTFALGVVLAYLCWQSRSIVPGMLAHLIHNTIGVVTAAKPKLFELIGVTPDENLGHLPMHVLLVGCGLFIVGLLIASRSSHESETASASQPVIAS